MQQQSPMNFKVVAHVPNVWNAKILNVKEWTKILEFMNHECLQRRIKKFQMTSSRLFKVGQTGFYRYIGAKTLE